MVMIKRCHGAGVLVGLMVMGAGLARGESPATAPATLELPATVEAYEQADLYAKTSGYISDLRVDIGSRVRAGEVLAVIDVPELVKELETTRAQEGVKEAGVNASESHVTQAEKLAQQAARQADRAKADLELKEITLRRKQELFAGKATTQQDLDEARLQRQAGEADLQIAIAKTEAAQADIASAKADQVSAAAQVQAAKAQVEQLEALVSYTHVIAPFDGLITRKYMDRGALLQASNRSPIVTIQRVDKVRVVAYVPESDAGRIKYGDSAKIKIGKNEIAGKVSRTSASLDWQTRTMRIEIDLPNGEGKFLNGMFAQVLFTPAE